MGMLDFSLCCCKASGLFQSGNKWSSQSQWPQWQRWTLDSTRNIAWDQCWWFQYSGLSANKQRWQPSSGVSLEHRFRCIAWYLASAICSRTVQIKTGVPVCIISSTLILDSERKLLDVMIWKMSHSVFDVIVFNRSPHSPWVRLPLSRKWHRSFLMAHCDTPVILNISLCETQDLRT